MAFELFLRHEAASTGEMARIRALSLLSYASRTLLDEIGNSERFSGATVAADTLQEVRYADTIAPGVHGFFNASRTAEGWLVNAHLAHPRRNHRALITNFGSFAVNERSILARANSLQRSWYLDRSKPQRPYKPNVGAATFPAIAEALAAGISDLPRRFQRQVGHWETEFA